MITIDKDAKKYVWSNDPDFYNPSDNKYYSELYEYDRISYDLIETFPFEIVLFPKEFT